MFKNYRLNLSQYNNKSSSINDWKKVEELKEECNKTIENINLIENHLKASKKTNFNASGFKLDLHIKCLKEINSNLFNYYRELSNESQKSRQSNKNHSKMNFKHSSNKKKNKNQMHRNRKLKDIKIVYNFSNVKFTNEQLNYLNKGPHYRPVPSKLPLDEIVVSIESGMKELNINHDDKVIIRHEIKKALENFKIPLANNNDEKILDELIVKGTEVNYIKPDGENKIVIINKNEYDQKIIEILNKSPFKTVRIDGRWKDGSPVNKSQNYIQNRLNFLNSKYLKNSNINTECLIESNPVLPEVYGIPKLHDDSYTMTISCCREKVTTSKIDDFLLKEFNIKNEKSVKNSQEFAGKMMKNHIDNDEVMVTIDFSPVFLSIHKHEIEDEITSFLDQHKTKSNRHYLIDLFKLSLNQNYLIFRNEIYEQTEGIAIGSKLSTLIKEIYMDNFEVKNEKLEWFPRIWYRCVDKVFAVVKSNKHKDLKNVKITKEHEASIPFLNILVRKEQKSFKFSINRKSSDNVRYVTNDSFHSNEVKQFWLTSLIERLISIPMTVSDYQYELIKIIDIAQYNGYSKSLCKDILENKTIDGTNTNGPDLSGHKTISVPYYPPLTNQIKAILQKQNIKLIFSYPNNILDILRSYLDKRSDLNKSGIYMIRCRDCPSVYIGQTKRSLKEREKEHNKKNNDKSPVSIHKRVQKHSVQEIKLLTAVDSENYLDAWESLHIFKNKQHLMNPDKKGKIPSILYSLC
ncbi:uncharacterized protein PF3D7_1120600-like [Chironomus tepperi]|uniref:uncharacterized protein PF3D7_1120600-like n=1 Tax=Chironomus tepperi TaxID=113505 RepID=UPI00391F0F07